MSDVDRALVARVRAAICAEISRHVGDDKWSMPFSLDDVARAAAAAALEREEKAA